MTTYKVIAKGVKGQNFSFTIEADSALDARAAIRELINTSEVKVLFPSRFATSAREATQAEIASARKIYVARRVGA